MKYKILSAARDVSKYKYILEKDKIILQHPIEGMRNKHINHHKFITNSLL